MALHWHPLTPDLKWYPKIDCAYLFETEKHIIQHRTSNSHLSLLSYFILPMCQTKAFHNFQTFNLNYPITSDYDVDRLLVIKLKRPRDRAIFIQRGLPADGHTAQHHVVSGRGQLPWYTTHWGLLCNVTVVQWYCSILFNMGIFLFRSNMKKTFFVDLLFLFENKLGF